MGKMIEDDEDDGEEAIVKRVQDARKASEDAHGEWREESRTSYAMVAGDQWDETDKAALKEKDRAPVVFNRLGVIIDAVSGSEVNNRQEVRYVPREIGDVAENEILTSAAQWVRDNCDAEDEESDAFVDVLICGIGWTETRMDYEHDPEGKCLIERVDPLEMRWDPSARKRNLADAKWVQRTRLFTKDEIEARWPDKEIDVAVEFTDDEDEEPKGSDPVDAYRRTGSTGLNTKEGRYPVIHHQWYETETVYQVLSPDSGQIITVEADRFKEIEKAFAGAGGMLQSVKITRRKYLQAFVCGTTLLESGNCPCAEDFCFQAITGRRDRNAGTWYGLVRPMTDPQRWANTFFSQILHIISTNAKGGLVVEQGAITNPRKFEKEWAKAESISTVNAGGLAKVMPKPISPVPQAINDMMSFAISSIRDSSGVSLELLGMVDREQAGYLEAQRTRAGLTILAGFFDALRLYRKRQGRVLAFYIQQYLSDGRLIKVVGKDREQFVPLLRQPETIKYDIVVDSAPTSRDMKDKTWAAMMEIMPLIQSQGLPIPPEVIDYSPLPSALVAAWKPELLKAKQQKETQDPMKQQLEMEGQMSQIRVQEATQIEQAKTQGELAKVQAQAQAKEMGTQADASGEIAKAQAQMQLKEKEMVLQAELEKFKAELQAQTQKEIAIIKGQADLQLENVKSEYLVKAARAGRPAAYKTREEADEADKMEEEAQKLLAAVAQAVSEDRGVLEQIAAKLSEVSAALGQVGAVTQELHATVNGPKEIVRDKQGRAVGVKHAGGVRQIVRGPDGRPVGLQ